MPKARRVDAVAGTSPPRLDTAVGLEMSVARGETFF